MSDRELDRRCAEILGYIGIKPSFCPGFYEGRRSLDSGSYVLPCFSTSLDACRELLEWALQSWPSNETSHYFLESIFAQFDHQSHSHKDMAVQLLRLAPRQICEAFVETFGKDK